MYYDKEIENINKEYVNGMLFHCIQLNFGLNLAPVQVNALRIMILNRYVVFSHGHGVGASFLLALLAVVLKLLNPKINIAISAEHTQQAKMVIENEFNKYKNKINISSVSVVDIDQAITGNYDVLLLDGITELSNDYVDALIQHIESESKTKIVGICNGYRLYYPIRKLISKVAVKGELITVGYTDMPEGYFDVNNITEAAKLFKFKEEFDMAYKGYCI